MSRRAKQTGKPLKQQTLTSFLPSSPQRGPPSPTNSKSRKLPISSQRTASARKPVPVPVDNNEDSDGDTSDVDAIQFEPDVIELSDEDASPRRPTTQRRGVPATQARGLKLDDDSGDLFSTRSDGSISESRKKVRLGKRKQVVELSESEEEAVQPRRRKLIKGTRPPSVDSDGEDLMEEVEEHRILQKRMRTRDKRTAFQKNLEKLKRKKLGLAAQSSSEDSANEEEEEEESPLRSSSVVPFAGAKPHTSDGEEGSEDESQDEDTFIVEDDAAAAELPPEFSMDTHQDLAHQFKIICQFFVHLAVQKPKDRHSYMEHTMKNTKYFSVPLQIARRKLSGLKDSLVASSVWRPDFKNQLQRYPTFELTSLSFAIPACDACHLGGRMSTLLGRVGGNPYDRMGFKPLDDISSSESESDDDKERPSKEFHLGRFCAKRTRVFHRFTHWEHALFESLEREVDELRKSDGSRGFVRVAFAKGIKPPEDLTDADGIMDWLDQRGIIDMEWQSVRELMESARNLEMASKRGENDVDVD
ncbi:hypothetical protein FIBSPDRAFT_827984 [Athelia psychrophila]|uniref:DUF4211 domain-containing protein n=1 Tax=Athelia psychrophila TaxID=1759441 RepID=A0A166I1P4_9AGAM|nr:hypothetical protein FIBSPDRAFT_827984 [Fibularhizoctonia sp. CBS 109695]